MNFALISPREVNSYLSRRDILIIDLRPPEEYWKSHLKGAVSIPYEQLQKKGIPADKVLFFYCDRGSMSMAAAREYAKKGYRTKTLVGGFEACREEDKESFR